eukprot:SAG22_NODE_4134_length_1372_cov_2.791830_1_plen_175_part_01
MADGEPAANPTPKPALSLRPGGPKNMLRPDYGQSQEPDRWVASVEALLESQGLGHTRALERIQRLWALFRGRRLPARQYVSELTSTLGGAAAAAPIIGDMVGLLRDRDLREGLKSAFAELQASGKQEQGKREMGGWGGGGGSGETDAEKKLRAAREQLAAEKVDDGRFVVHAGRG